MQEKLMKVKSWEDGDVLYRVACDCGDPNHDAHLWFEAIDKDHTDISMSLSIEVGFYPKHINWFESMARRLRAASKIIFTGYFTCTGEVILDEDGLKAMRTGIDKGLQHAKGAKARWDAQVKENLEKKNAEKENNG
jgi:hypothetical protein